jgi:hypothetical protein
MKCELKLIKIKKSKQKKISMDNIPWIERSLPENYFETNKYFKILTLKYNPQANDKSEEDHNKMIIESIRQNFPDHLKFRYWRIIDFQEYPANESVDNYAPVFAQLPKSAVRFPMTLIFATKFIASAKLNRTFFVCATDAVNHLKRASGITEFFPIETSNSNVVAEMSVSIERMNL